MHVAKICDNPLIASHRHVRENRQPSNEESVYTTQTALGTSVVDDDDDVDDVIAMKQHISCRNYDLDAVKGALQALLCYASCLLLY